MSVIWWMQCYDCNAMTARRWLQCKKSMLCIQSFAINAMQSLICNQCFAINALQSMICNQFCAINAMQLMQWDQCNVMLACSYQKLLQLGAILRYFAINLSFMPKKKIHEAVLFLILMCWSLSFEATTHIWLTQHN